MPFCPKCNTKLLAGKQDGLPVLFCYKCQSVVSKVSDALLESVPATVVQKPSEPTSTLQKAPTCQTKVSLPVSIELPLPLKGCTPNFSGAWQQRSKDRKAYRTDCSSILWHELGKIGNGDILLDRVRLSFTWYMGKPFGAGDRHVRPNDTDVAIGCIKQVIDAMQDACIIKNDNSHTVQFGDIVLHRKKSEHGGRCCIVMTIENWKE